jgi:capsule polysaccharide export protein KpsE/RkpR
VDKGTQRVSSAIDRPIEVEVPSRDASLSELFAKSGQGPGLEKLNLLWDHRQFLFRVVVCGLVLSAILAFVIPKEYTSTVSLMPPDQQSSLGAAALAAFAGKGGDGIGALAGDVLGMKSSGDLFIGVMRSRTVQDDLIQRFDLRKVYGVRLWESARKQLAKNTGLLQDHKSQIITIDVTDRRADRAAAIAQQYASELNRVVNQLSTSAAHRKREFLEGRLKEVEQDLEAAEKEFSQFSSKNTAIDIKEQGKAMVAAAASLQAELIATQSELEGYRQIYTENNVRGRAARARIAELRKQLGNMGGGDISGAEGGGESLYPSIKKLPLLGVTYADLYRRTKIDEAVFEALTQQYELAKVEEAKDIPSVKILDDADVPERKSFPPRLLMMLVGTCFAFLVGALWVIGSTRWVQVDPSDARKLLAQEVFTTVKTGFFRSRNGSNGDLQHRIVSKVFHRDR